MTLPDSATLDRLCEAAAAVGECADGHCDGCVIQRAMLHSSGIQSYLLVAMCEIAEADRPDRMAARVLACIAAGFLLGMQFARENQPEKTRVQ